MLKIVKTALLLAQFINFCFFIEVMHSIRIVKYPENIYNKIS